MKYSCILPVGSYNMQWLERSIRSTVPFDEVIVVADEGAQFHTAFFHNPGISSLVMVQKPGTWVAINAGVSVATGDYISVLCSDDWYSIDGVDAIIKHINDTPEKMGMTDIVYGQVMFHGDLGGHPLWPATDNVSEMAHHNCIPSPAFVRRRLFYAIEGYRNYRYADWEFYMRAVAFKATLKFIPTVFYNYYGWPGCISAGYGYKSDLPMEPME